MNHKLITKLKQIRAYDSNSCHGLIAKVLLDRIDDLPNFNIGRYAQLCQCSKGALTKFAQQLGFKGTKDLIPQIIYEHQFFRLAALNQKNESADQSCYVFLKNSHRLILEAVDFVYAQNLNALVELVKLLQIHRRLFLIGKGANLDIINIFANYLGKLDFHVTHSTDFEVQQK